MMQFIDITTPTETHPSGLLSVGNFTSRSDEKWTLGIEFEEVCGAVSRGEAPCTLPVEKEGFDKSYGEATSRPLYSMMTCSLIGGENDLDLALHNHELGIGRAVEALFADMLTATDIGDQSDPVLALAKLIALWPHGVLPTVHLGPDVAILLAAQGALELEDGKAHLKTGERVSIGYGYLDAKGPGFVALTGPVFGFYGALKDYMAQTVRENTHTILVEQNWLVASTCTALSATITY